MSEALSVEVENLVKKFGDFTAVDHVTFQVQRGEIFGFLGSNGAGKSTTIRMLCGLLRPSAGKARVGGFDIYSQTDRIKENIGYMSQRFSLYDELTVEENLDFFGGIYGIAAGSRRQIKEEALEMADLRGQRHTPTGLLAGGWKQRLALTCAVLHRPPILFLDEPTSGVDPIARRQFWGLIYRLAEEGHTVFVTTHYMDEAEYCHRLVLMHDGRIIAMATPDELRRTQASYPLLELECAHPLEAMRALEVLETVVDVAFFGGGLRLRVKDAEAASEETRRTLGELDIPVIRLEGIEPTMEEVFTGLIQDEEQKG